MSYPILTKLVKFHQFENSREFFDSLVVCDLLNSDIQEVVPSGDACYAFHMVVKRGTKYGIFRIADPIPSEYQDLSLLSIKEPFIFDDIIICNTCGMWGFVIVKQGKKWGVVETSVDYSLQLIVPIEYDSWGKALEQVKILLSPNLHTYNPFDGQNNYNKPRETITKEEIVDALSYIGIESPNDFSLRNEFFKYPVVGSQRNGKHGIGHIYRVMIGAALLSKELEEPKLGFYAFCGAFIHDLGRINDGKDYGHGLRSAKESFHQFNNIWTKYNLSNYEKNIIQAASANHTAHEEHNFQGTWCVDQIVRDADALDRCRFINHGKLDSNYLEFKQSNRLIKVIEFLCKDTSHWIDDISFEDFISMTTQTQKPTQKQYHRNFSPEKISRPMAENQIIVFNQKMNGGSKSNTARVAVKAFHASNLVGEGLTGQAYAIPTDSNDLKEISIHVKKFIEFARENPQFDFLVTKIGCGVANFHEHQIAPLFKEAIDIENIFLPKDFVTNIY